MDGFSGSILCTNLTPEMRTIDWDEYVHQPHIVCQVAWLGAGGPMQFPEHNHRRQSEIILVTRGHLRHTLNGESCPLEAGESILIRDRDIHSLDGGRGEMVNIAFRGDFSRQIQQSLPPGPVRLDNEEIRTLLDFADLLRRDRQDQNLVLLECLLWYRRRAERTTSTEIAGQGPDWLRRALHQMEFCPAPSLALFHEYCGRSPEHIARVLRQARGKSPSELVNALRIRRVKDALVTSSHEVTRIALDSGFRSLSSFYREFDRHVGMSPKEFRRRRQENPYLTAPQDNIESGTAGNREIPD